MREGRERVKDGADMIGHSAGTDSQGSARAAAGIETPRTMKRKAIEATAEETVDVILKVARRALSSPLQRGTRREVTANFVAKWIVERLANCEVLCRARQEVAVIDLEHQITVTVVVDVLESACPE